MVKHPCLTPPGAAWRKNRCHYDTQMVCECGLTKLEIDMWQGMTPAQREIAARRASERRACTSGVQRIGDQG